MGQSLTAAACLCSMLCEIQSRSFDFVLLKFLQFRFHNHTGSVRMAQSYFVYVVNMGESGTRDPLEVRQLPTFLLVVTIDLDLYYLLAKILRRWG